MGFSPVQKVMGISYKVVCAQRQFENEAEGYHRRQLDYLIEKLLVLDAAVGAFIKKVEQIQRGTHED